MTPSTFKSKYKNNPKAKNFLKDYYVAFRESAKKEVKNPFETEFGCSFNEGFFVSHTKQTRESSNEFTKLVTKLLGPRYGDEKEISDLVEKQAFISLKEEDNNDEFLEKVLEHISEILNQDFEVFLPNVLVALASTVNSITIGAVRIITLSALEEEELQPVIENLNIPKERGNLAFNQQENTIKIANMLLPSSKIMWAVKTHTNKTHINEEALWRIGVAISLLKLSSSNWDGRQPRIGEVQLNPVFRTPHSTTSALTRNGNSLSGGGGKVPGYYYLDSNVEADLAKKDTQDLFNSIFDYSKGQVAEQIFNALGWLDKGRQEQDRSARLLNFFTAIETLLTQASNYAPVTDTIARHGAVILSEKITVRQYIAKEFKQLYAYRSATVHRGKRNTSSQAVKQVEFYAEALLREIIKNVDLKITHSDFCEQLTNASFGTEWPNEK